VVRRAENWASSSASKHRRLDRRRSQSIETPLGSLVGLPACAKLFSDERR
jgi:hypothetical protein